MILRSCGKDILTWIFDDMDVQCTYTMRDRGIYCVFSITPPPQFGIRFSFEKLVQAGAGAGVGPDKVGF